MARKRKPSPELQLRDIRSSDYNPRQIERSSAAALNKSMRVFGDLSGIVFNTQTGNLVTGHQRWSQLKKTFGPDNMTLKVLDHESAVVVCTDPDGGASGEQWPIRLVDWSLQHEMAANIAANSTELAGGFTDDLESVLLTVAESDPDLYEDLLMMNLEADQKAERPALTESQLSGMEYRIVVTVAGETEQAELFERLKGEGFDCKLMTS